MLNNIIDSIKVSGVTYEIQGSGGITIDPTLDSGSTNPVANSAITTALDAKVNVADNEVSGLTIKNIPYYGVAYPYGKVEKLYFTSKISDNVNNAVFYPYAITSDGTTIWYTITYSIQNGVITSVTSSNPSSVAASLEDGVACLTFIDRTFHHFWQDYSNRFDFWFYSDYTGGQSADVIEGSVADAISDTYNDAIGLASTRVDKNDNHASGLTVGFYIGAKEYFNSTYNITKLTIKSTVSSGSGTRTVSFYIIPTTGGSSVNCSVKYTYQNTIITAINSTSGNITATVNNGAVDVTIDSGYYFYYINSINNFALIGYRNYSGGQSARVIEGSVNQALNDVATKIPPISVVGVSMYHADNGTLNLERQYSSGSSWSNTSIPLNDEKTLKYDTSTGLYVNFKGQSAHTNTLNTSSGNYCYIPSVAASYDYAYDSFTVRVNSGYTGSSTSFTWTISGISEDGGAYANVYVYDKTSNTVTLTSRSFEVDVTQNGYYFTFTANNSYTPSNPTKLTQFREGNCSICGTGNTIPNAYIIDLVQAPTYEYNGQEIIDDIYSKLDTKQTTLTAGTGISIVDNVISAEGGGGGGKAIEAGRGISITTGETADTVSFNLPISADSNTFINAGVGNTNNNTALNILIGSGNTAYNGNGGTVTGGTAIGFGNTIGYIGRGNYSKSYSFAFGYGNGIQGGHSYTIGDNNNIGRGTNNSKDNSFLIGYYNTCTFNGDSSGDYIFGNYCTVSKSDEFALGKYNVSNTGSTDADRTFFSIGNGTANNARHNAFEIRQNGDIYLSSGGTDIKLQDHLGGGGGGGSSYTAGDGIDITNDVISVTGKVDTSTYNTYTAATDSTLANKQTTLTAGTNITIVDNVISATGGGGGGKAIEAGRGISVTTGETADTVSFDLPISAGTSPFSVCANSKNNTSSGQYAFAIGHSTNATGMYSFAEGNGTTANGQQSHAEGCYTTASTVGSHAEGIFTKTTNNYEHASGQYNVSNSATTAFGDSGNTLFSVGNGTGDNARHNAFEIRQNGDIYLSSGGTDIKLQDHLGGGGASYSAGTGIDITNNVISVSGVVETSSITTAITSSSTDAQVPSAKAVYDIVGDIETLLSQI